MCVITINETRGHEFEGKVSGKAFKEKNGMEKLCNYNILSINK